MNKKDLLNSLNEEKLKKNDWKIFNYLNELVNKEYKVIGMNNLIQMQNDISIFWSLFNFLNESENFEKTIEEIVNENLCMCVNETCIHRYDKEKCFECWKNMFE